MKTEQTGRRTNAPEVSRIAAALSRRLNRVRRNQRILVQTVKNVMAAQRDKIPPARDPLAP